MQLVGECRIHFLDFVLMCCWVLMFSLVISLVRSAESEEIYMSPRELFSDGAFYILWFIFLFNGQGVNFVSSLYKVGLPFLHYTRLVYHFFTIQGKYTISLL